MRGWEYFAVRGILGLAIGQFIFWTSQGVPAGMGAGWFLTGLGIFLLLAAAIGLGVQIGTHGLREDLRQIPRPAREDSAAP